MATQDDLTTANAPEAGSKWVFDSDVAQSFDDMLERSIPNYGDMRKMVTRAAAWHLRALEARDGAPQLIVDIGASRGTALRPIVDKLGAHSRYLALDISEPMLVACQEAFHGYIEAGIFEVKQWDLREGFYSTFPPAVILSVLTLQFVPIEHRQRLLREACARLKNGGAMIIVEKVLGANAELDAMEVDLYYDTKRDQGYEQEAIDRKRLSLEGVLVPLTARFNEELFRDAGFDGVDCVWAWANFRAWIAHKR